MGWIRQDGLVCCSLVEQIGRELGLAVDFSEADAQELLISAQFLMIHPVEL